MKFTRGLFAAAGIYGVLVLFPLYFSETRMGIEFPPPLNHPEHYYSFISVTLVWQFLFFLVARDPLKYKNVIPFCALEKSSLIPTFFILYPQGRFPSLWIPLLIVDLTFGAMFLVAFSRLKQPSGGS
jgi:hypothetical protein